MGIIEFRGVRSSWAMDEKKVLLIFCIIFSPCLMFVMSVHITIISYPLLITEDFTWIYFLGCLDLKTVSTLVFASCMWIMYDQRLSRVSESVPPMLFLLPEWSEVYSTRFLYPSPPSFLFMLGMHPVFDICWKELLLVVPPWSEAPAPPPVLDLS